MFKTSWKKEKMKEMDFKETPKTLMPPKWVQIIDGGENLENNFEAN